MKHVTNWMSSSVNISIFGRTGIFAIFSKSENVIKIGKFKIPKVYTKFKTTRKTYSMIMSISMQTITDKASEI